MNNFKVTRSEWVELNVPATSLNQTIYFPDLPNLRNSRTWGLSSYNADNLSFSLSGGDAISYTLSKGLLVYLYFDNGLFIVQPYTTFANVYYGGQNDPGYFEKPVEFVGQRITWSKSYIQITNVSALASYQGKSFMFNVYYTLN